MITEPTVVYTHDDYRLVAVPCRGTPPVRDEVVAVIEKFQGRDAMGEARWERYGPRDEQEKIIATTLMSLYLELRNR